MVDLALAVRDLADEDDRAHGHRLLAPNPTSSHRTLAQYRTLPRMRIAPYASSVPHTAQHHTRLQYQALRRLLGHMTYMDCIKDHTLCQYRAARIGRVGC
eukprot:3025629-Rhodomonas_salina.1